MYADKQIKLNSFHIQEPNKIVELKTAHFGFKIHQEESLSFPLQTNKKDMPRLTNALTNKKLNRYDSPKVPKKDRKILFQNTKIV